MSSVDRTCPICSNTEWNLRDKIFEITELPDDNKLFGSSTYPVIILKCTVCGYSHLINAIDIGAIE